MAYLEVNPDGDSKSRSRFCSEGLGLCSACFGLLIGAMHFAVRACAWWLMATASDEAAGGAFFGTLIGAGAIIIMPIFYGIFGFIGGLIYAFIFNFAAKCHRRPRRRRQ